MKKFGIANSGGAVAEDQPVKHLRSTLGATFVGAAAALSVSVVGGTVAGTPAPTATAAPVSPAAAGSLVTAPPAKAAAPLVMKPQASEATSDKPRHLASKSNSTKTTKKPKTSSPKHRAKPSSSAGCGQRAVTAGVFNSSCDEYQGYLDPGRAGGRAPSSGDIQSDWMDCTAKKTAAQCRAELN